MFCGTGCLLVKREVFEKLKPPYFRTDIKWNPTNYGNFIRLTAMQGSKNSEDTYGLHDVTFGMKLWKENIPISVIGTIGQRKLVELGKPGSNDGAHKIEEWVDIEPDMLLKRFQSYPVQSIGKLVEVQTVSGTLNVMPGKAKKLIKAGVATAISVRSVSVDYGDISL